MGIISGILGNTPIATSGMKGAQTGQYGQSGIVGTILKMYLGGAIGGALGGAAGQGASGLEGATSGIGSVTDSLGSIGSGGGLGGLGGNIGGGLGDVGASLDQGIEGSGGMGAAGDFLQSQIVNSGDQQQSSQDMSQPQVSNMPAPQGMEAIQGIMGMIQRGQGNPQQQDNGLISQSGIPDYIKQMMQRWQK